MFISIPLSYVIIHSRPGMKLVLESLISLPIVLPPTVLGFYLLLLFSPNSFIGRSMRALDLDLIFSFRGLVVASVIYSLPFMLQPILAGLSNLPRSYAEAASTYGRSSTNAFLTVLLPNVKPSILSGIVLTIAHTLGEFGVVLMIGGSIPGETRLASLAVWEQVEALNYRGAHLYSLILFVVSFAIIFVVSLINRKGFKVLHV